MEFQPAVGQFLLELLLREINRYIVSVRALQIHFNPFAHTAAYRAQPALPTPARVRVCPKPRFPVPSLDIFLQSPYYRSSMEYIKGHQIKSPVALTSCCCCR